MVRFLAGCFSTAGPSSAKGGSPQYLAALVLFVFLDALCYPLITLGLQSAPHLTFAFLRALIAGCALGLLVLILKRPIPRGAGVWLRLGGIGLGTTSLGFAGMFHASEFVAPGMATIISHTQPFVAAILAFFFLRERLAPLQLFGLVVAFSGVVVVSIPQLSAGGTIAFAAGLVYLAVATLGVAAGNILTKSLGAKVDPLVGTAAQLLIGSIPLGIATAIEGHSTAIDWTPKFVAALLGLALLGSALARSLWFSILETVPLSQANAFTFLSPFIAVVLGVMFFSESISFATAAGLVLTTVGVVFVEHGPRSRYTK